MNMAEILRQMEQFALRIPEPIRCKKCNRLVLQGLSPQPITTCNNCKEKEVRMSQHPLQCIIFNEKTYIRVVPGKKLFQSTLVHSVVNRGDVFAVCLETGVLTILPGNAQVEKVKALVSLPEKEPEQRDLFAKFL